MFYHSWGEWLADLQEQLSVMRAAFGQVNLTKWQMARFFVLQLWRDTPFWLRGLVLAMGVVVLLSWLEGIVSPYFSTARRLGIPELGVATKPGNPYYYQQMLLEAGEKYPHTPFYYRIGHHERVVFPSGYASEIKKLTDETASLLEFGRLATFDGWNILGGKESSSTFHKVASSDFARSLPPLVKTAQAAVSRECDLILGRGEKDDEARKKAKSSTQRVPLMNFVNQLVVASNQVALVGEPLARDRPWLTAIRFLSVTVAIGHFTSWFSPRLLHPVWSYVAYTPARLLHSYLSRRLQPSIQREMEQWQRQKETSTDQQAGKMSITEAKGDKKGAGADINLVSQQPTLLSLLVRRYGEQSRADWLCGNVLTASYTATISSVVTLYNFFVEMLLVPGLVEELRAEALSVAHDGRLPATRLDELAKLDSVLRETARLNGVLAVTMGRVLQKPHQFSIGPLLPKGTFIMVDEYNTHRSPVYYDDPETFDPMRHYRKRQQPGHETRHQFVSNGPDFLFWGDGPQVCPGKTFANHNIKIVIAHLLLNYDMELDPPGRPAKLFMPNGATRPSLTVALKIRPRH
ncbi:hypothetical protein QTJ16_006100 [Diplocarpon rosae]|uniref:Cytochrome P450 n=1 Tax=Diplocarpon rosae TaxID=946125 RepID=A0AAD9SXN2_9HELO|nr:hypothetical protein QTJ16_006100 [Diplocarpon rosae]